MGHPIPHPSVPLITQLLVSPPTVPSNTFWSIYNAEREAIKNRGEKTIDLENNPEVMKRKDIFISNSHWP